MRIKGLTINFFDSKIYGNTNITTPLKFQDGYWKSAHGKGDSGFGNHHFHVELWNFGSDKYWNLGPNLSNQNRPWLQPPVKKTQPYLVFRKRWWPVFPPVGHRLLDEKRWNLSKNKDTSRLRPDSRDFFRRKNTSESELDKQQTNQYITYMFIHLHFYSIPVKGPCKRWEG